MTWGTAKGECGVIYLWITRVTSLTTNLSKIKDLTVPKYSAGDWEFQDPGAGRFHVWEGPFLDGRWPSWRSRRGAPWSL